MGQKLIRYQLKDDTAEESKILETTPIFDLELPKLLESKGVEFGPIRDRLADIMAERQQTFVRLVTRAQQAGDIHDSVDPDQLAYELDMLLFGANWAFQLYGDGDVIVRSQAAMRHRLKSVVLIQKTLPFEVAIPPPPLDA
ncbi:TetR family transcriptional regulator C-terminal domain-containing protein [Acaryochloris sp. CCMEE 5410]|uniref:TetR family transcriptional regulator C-terminal domain-containing protein n=1 Tax=Acaryochloris sp. CCMEE 5410 TaxID=310037 RepID=UPI0021D0346A|nr:hypothetical protein [Acaryochloris sp. CCMEE 5410]